MEAILKFNLPEDNASFELATKASGMFHVLWEMDRYLKQHTKYAPDDMNEEAYKAYTNCRETLNELMSQENINFI
jgi:hypothetical protein